METLLKDVRHSIRYLLKHRSFTIIAVLAIALGVGANTAVFSVVNAALLRSLPYRESDRLVDISETKMTEQFGRHEASYPDYLDLRQRPEVFEDVAGYTGAGSMTLSGTDTPERVTMSFVTANFFSVLGVEPTVGRTFRPGDDVKGAERTVVLGYSVWQRRFGGDPNAVGQTLVFDGQPFTVVGVVPASFRFAKVGSVEVWGAFIPPPRAERRNLYFLNTVARLKQGVAFEQAQSAMHAEGQRLSREYPDSHAGVDILLVPLRDELVGNVKPVLLALLGAVAFVLLIACSNVANLLLARSAARRKEIAVRLALGASRWRVVRQLLTESAVLSIVGGGVGLLLGIWGTDLFVSAIPTSLVGFMPYMKDAGVDRATLAFTFGVSMLTGLVFGIVPALQATRHDPQEALKEGGKTSAPARSTLRSALVVSEIALALVLLVGAGLMMRSFVGLLGVDPGFDPANVLSVEVPLTGQTYSETSRVLAFHEQLRERVSSIPGVRGVAAVDLLPVGGGGGNTASFGVRGRPAPAPGDGIEANVRSVTTGYFDVMSVPLLAGRQLSDQDIADRPPVVVVNRTLATRVFADENPVGQAITFGFDPKKTPYEIVGVVGDEKVGQIDAGTTPVIYFPHAQDGGAEMSLVVRTTADPTSLVGAVRAAVHDLDPNVALGSAVTMEEVIANSPSAFLRRYPAFLAGVLALIAFVLALEGIYGVMSYTVSQRTHEIGVRVAIGAGRGNIYALVLRQGMGLAVAGVAVGLVASLALTRFLSSLLFGVSPTDPLTFGGVAALLVGVALVACYVPARRAARVDPVVALRSE